MSVKEKMTALADAIRGKTGATEALTLDAMIAAIAGISGSTSNGTSGICMVRITPAEDLSALTVTHNLGTTDILFAAAWVETLGDVVPAYPGALAKFWAKTDIPNNSSGAGFCAHAGYNTANAYAVMGAPISAAYWDEVVDENTFRFNQAGLAAAKYIAGVTYTVLIVAACA